MNNLDKNLYTKHELKFNENGKFKILMMSDIQETLSYDVKTLEYMDKLIEKTQPNFIILGGDNCDGTILKTEEELKKYLEIFTQPMENEKFHGHISLEIMTMILKLMILQKQKCMKILNIVFQNI